MKNNKLKSLVRFLALGLALIMAMGIILPSLARASETEIKKEPALVDHVLTLMGTDGGAFSGVDVSFALGRLSRIDIDQESGQQVRVYEPVVDKDGFTIVLNKLTTNINGQVDLRDLVDFETGKISVSTRDLAGILGEEWTFEEIENAINKAGLTEKPLKLGENPGLIPVVDNQTIENLGAVPVKDLTVIDPSKETDQAYTIKYYNDRISVTARAVKLVEENDEDKKLRLERGDFSLVRLGTTSAVTPTQTQIKGTNDKGLVDFSVRADSIEIDKDGKLKSPYVLRQTATDEGYQVFQEDIKLEGSLDKGYLDLDLEGVEVYVKTQKLVDTKGTSSILDDEVKIVVEGLEVSLVNTLIEEEKEDLDILRLEGSSRYTTAIDVSQRAYPDGAKTVVLASGENMADALAAGPLAIAKDGPILLTGKLLPREVEKELNRLEPAEVILVGGGAWLPEEVKEAVKAPARTVIRLAGDDRYQTSLEIADYLGSEKIVLAEGSKSVDALTVAAYAGTKDLAIVLTASQELPGSVRDFIEEEGIDHVEIVGGPASVSKEIEESIGSSFKGRIQGANRYETALELARLTYDEPEAIVLVNSDRGLVDALSAAPYAYKEKAPILLTEKDKLNLATKEYIWEIEPLRASLIGGMNSISSFVEEELIYSELED